MDKRSFAQSINLRPCFSRGSIDSFYLLVGGELCTLVTSVTIRKFWSIISSGMELTPATRALIRRSISYKKSVLPLVQRPKSTGLRRGRTAKNSLSLGKNCGHSKLQDQKQNPLGTSRHLESIQNMLLRPGCNSPKRPSAFSSSIGGPRATSILKPSSLSVL